MLELAVRATLPDDRPTVFLEQLEDVANLHDAFSPQGAPLLPSTSVCSRRAIDFILSHDSALPTPLLHSSLDDCSTSRPGTSPETGFA